MDVRMLQARGATPLAVPACLTVQNRSGCRAVQPVSLDLLTAMVGAALDDGRTAAVKTGLLGSAAAVERVAALLRDVRAAGVPLVVDPVLSATAGGFEAAPDVVEAYLVALVPLATVVTPNLPELARLAGSNPASLLARGAEAVLVKGGHAHHDPVEDRLYTAAGELALRHPRLAVGEVRGTGCALASAVACELGGGAAVAEACRSAVAHLGRCLELTRPAARDGAAMLAVV
jgi:hydroxymethylpyrimidine/phosphomethylpyrimidine kinase